MGHSIALIIVALMVVISHFSLSRRKKILIHYEAKPTNKELIKAIGQANKAMVNSRIAEKMAERAFSLASSANVGVGLLSKSLVTRPKWVTKTQAVKDEVVQKQVEDLFGRDSSEWIKPLLDDDELSILEEAQRQTEKARKNGKII